MILECKELTKWYGDTAAVAELTLNLSEGKIYGFLGENGSGKTTWMKMVASTVFTSSICQKAMWLLPSITVSVQPSLA